MRNQIQKLTVENFLSFNTKQVVDFSKNHLICFVGHNGSGKTNLLLAISALADCYLNTKGNKRRIATSFDQQEKPTVLSIELLVGEEKYCYTVESLTSKRKIIKEELRNKEDKLVLDFELHSDIGDLSSIEEERITTYSLNDIGIFHLLFSEQVKIQTQAIMDAVNKVGYFFENIVFVKNSSVNNFDYEKELYNSEGTKKMVLKFMNKMNYEIDDIIIDKATGHRLELFDILNDDLNSNESAVKLLEALKKLLTIMPEDQQTEHEIIYDIKSLKRPYLKNPVSIGLESAGVRRLIEILTWIFANKSKIILVDELEKGFHEVLVMNLIKEVNNNVNQFIFTSHLLELMTRDCLTKNQLFSIVKERGQSIVYAISTIGNIRDDRHSLKSLYRAGKIPGYPIVSED
jgi:AAA15 family ATPase/GTPase